MMAVLQLEKSTIVRIRTAALRLQFRIAESTAPRLGARLAAGLWFKTPRSPRPAPLPAGGTPFEVTAMKCTVRGTYWGEGPVVYVMHGWGGRGDQFADYVEPLRTTGHRVVMFDALSHGVSDPGPSGPGRANGVEFGHALDAVVARFGPARAIVAHSMGAISMLLAMRDGWVGADRLVMIAPMTELDTYFERFGAAVGFGPRVRRALDARTEGLIGLTVADFALDQVAEGIDRLPPTLVIHDRGDRETSYETSARIVATWPEAAIVGTENLGHRRILRDPGVVGAAVSHVLAGAVDPDERADAIA